MKIQAFILKDTNSALLLANRRTDTENPVTTAWVPRSVIPHLRKFGLKPGQEGQPQQCEAEVEDWFVKKTPALDEFKEV